MKRTNFSLNQLMSGLVTLVLFLFIGVSTLKAQGQLPPLVNSQQAISLLENEINVITSNGKSAITPADFRKLTYFEIALTELRKGGIPTDVAVRSTPLIVDITDNPSKSISVGGQVHAIGNPTLWSEAAYTALVSLLKQ